MLYLGGRILKSCSRVPNFVYDFRGEMFEFPLMMMGGHCAQTGSEDLHRHERKFYPKTDDTLRNSFTDFIWN